MLTLIAIIQCTSWSLLNMRLLSKPNKLMWWCSSLSRLTEKSKIVSKNDICVYTVILTFLLWGHETWSSVKSSLGHSLSVILRTANQDTHLLDLKGFEKISSLFFVFVWKAWKIFESNFIRDAKWKPLESVHISTLLLGLRKSHSVFHLRHSGNYDFFFWIVASSLCYKIANLKQVSFFG